MRISVDDLVEALGATRHGDGPTTFDLVSVDSRSVPSGALFVPLVAERDGHEFVAGAFEAGAAVTLTARGDGSALASDHPGLVALEVPNTDRALRDIGAYARGRLTGPVIGITGSVGKTSVKDLTLAACGSAYRTWASERSFNNEIGVPLTLANAPDGTEIAIVEMGARGVGHIADLCAIARPTIGVVTTVAMAHSELFGSIETVAEAKGELIDALAADGVAVLNADDPLVAAMASRAAGRVIRFGYSDTADVRLGEVEVDAALRPRFELSYEGRAESVRLGARGAHMAHNASAAVAAAVAAGVPFDVAVAGVGSAELSPWRMEVASAPSGVVVINDAYNANPVSMRAALDSLCLLDATVRVAVVGLMAELGDEGPAEHEAVAREAVARGVRVIAVDATDYGEAAEHVATVGEAHDLVAGLGEAGAVLVKGSRVAGLERLAEQLLAT